MEMTIKQLAEMAGVTTRRLRYYDEIGLLKPARLSEAGYRLYSQHEIDRLQHILFYKELEVPLGEIVTVMTKDSFDDLTVLETHRMALLEKQKRIAQVLTTLDRTLEQRKGGTAMTNEEKFEGFKKQLIADNEEKYGKEVREKYGDETVNASNAKMMGLSEDDYQQMQQTEQHMLDLLKQVAAENNTNSEAAQQVTELHKKWLMYSWTTYSPEAHKGIAEMYVADSRFAEYYDKHGDGSAQCLRDCIVRWAK